MPFTAPPPLICLEGSPQEMGRRHGLLLGQEIRHMRRALWGYLCKAGLLLGALPLAALLHLLAKRFWPRIPAPLREEMRALAEAANLDLATILLINVLDDLANCFPRCSALAASPESSLSGAPLMGRNLDYPLFTDVLIKLQTLFSFFPLRGLPLVSVAWPGYVGVCTGLNRAGLAVSQLSAMCKKTTLKGVPAALRFRQALESADSLGKFWAALQGHPATIGNTLLLASPREILAVEISPVRMVVRPARHGLLTATNHFQSPQMTPLMGRFPSRPPFSALSPYHFTEAYSRARNQRLLALASGRILGPREIQQILADPQIANPGTVVSAVFVPAELSLWLAQGKTPPVSQAPFQEIRPWQ